MWILGLKGLNKTVLKTVKEGINNTANTKGGMDGQTFRRLKQIVVMFFLKTYHPNSCSKLFFVYNRAIYMRKNKMRLSLDAS